MGYTKLFNEILASTIWDDEWFVKVAWITILAMKDDRHQVMASIPGLAHLARISVDQAQQAINKFCSPDPYSRSKEHEGRRLQPIDGGWFVLNGPKYSHRLSVEDKKEYQRLWVKNKRLQEKLDQYTTVDMSRQKSTVDDVDDVETTEHNRTEQNKTKHSKKNTHTSNDVPVNEVFHAYKASWNKSDQYKLSDQRKRWIRNAFQTYDLAHCLQAVQRFRDDPFEKRAEFNDLKYLFGTQDRIDKWCGESRAPSKVMNKAVQKHQESKERLEIVNQMIDSDTL